LSRIGPRKSFRGEAAADPNENAAKRMKALPGELALLWSEVGCISVKDLIPCTSLGIRHFPIFAARGRVRKARSYALPA
jgi:hypothetical protein